MSYLADIYISCHISSLKCAPWGTQPDKHSKKFPLLTLFKHFQKEELIFTQIHPR